MVVGFSPWLLLSSPFSCGDVHYTPNLSPIAARVCDDLAWALLLHRGRACFQSAGIARCSVLLAISSSHNPLPPSSHPPPPPSTPRTYQELWDDADRTLRDLKYTTDPPPKDPIAAAEAAAAIADATAEGVASQPSPADKEASREHFGLLYIKFIQIFKKLATSYDQMTHPQKRRVLRLLLEGTMGRLLELKGVLVEIECTCFCSAAASCSRPRVLSLVHNGGPGPGRCSATSVQPLVLFFTFPSSICCFVLFFLVFSLYGRVLTRSLPCPSSSYTRIRLGTDYNYFDDILADVKLTPEDIEIETPAYFRRENLKQLKERERILDDLGTCGYARRSTILNVLGLSREGAPPSHPSLHLLSSLFLLC